MGAIVTETAEARLKRLKIRSWRRGTKEMDLILGRYFDAHGETMDEPAFAAYEALLNENDQDLYLWVSGQGVAPAEHEALIVNLREYLKNST